MFKILLISIITGLSFSGIAQSSLQDVLQSVEKNNPRLKAQQQYLEAQNLGFRSKNNLANPEFEWEKNFSPEDGRPDEILVSQSFDFPSSYLYRNQLKKEQIANLENIRARFRQEVLLKTQLTCFNLIYCYKQKQELDKRRANAKKLSNFFEKRLQEGDANILEVNKIRMLLLNTNNRLQMVLAKIANLREDLKQLNGGVSVNMETKEYPFVNMEQDIEKLQQEILSEDPFLKSLGATEKMASKETALVKTNSLPKFSIGYRYLNSDILKQANGMKLGLSIPLWENKNKLKKARLMEQFRKEEFAIGKMEKETEFQKLFQTYAKLQKSLQDYQKIFAEKEYDNLLHKALDYGEISGIEYLMESIYFYESFDTYLEIEHEYFKTIAMILKYRL